MLFNRFAYQSNALEGGVLQDAVRTERNTVRASLDWSLPLYGTFE